MKIQIRRVSNKQQRLKNGEIIYLLLDVNEISAYDKRYATV